MAGSLDHDNDYTHNYDPTDRKTELEALSLHVQSQTTQTIQKVKRSFKDTLCLRITLAVVLLTVAGLVLQPVALKHRKRYTEDEKGLPLQTLRYRQVDEVVRFKREVDIDQQQDNESIIDDIVFLLNCTPRAIEQFPNSFLPRDFNKVASIVIYVSIALYMFLSLAIVCDDYFVPALQRLTCFFSINSDVGGATFMAIGSSAPELFTSIIGVVVAKSDVGIGTIVGSAVFNIFFISAACSFAISNVPTLRWWPIFRDCFVYLIAIVALVLALMNETINWYESVALLLMYFLYVIIIFFNNTLEAKAYAIIDAVLKTDFSESNEKCYLLDSDENRRVVYTQRNAAEVSVEVMPGKNRRRATGNSNYSSNSSGASSDMRRWQESILSSSLDSLYVDPLTFPETTWKRCLWVLMFPIKIILYFTVPDCRQPMCFRFCICTFIVSIIWIGIFSYIMVWVATLSGDIFEIPDTVIGFTILAMGTSMPDCIASIIVAKDGFLDMAISNTIGSNVFDILIGLGFPWLLQSLVNDNKGVTVYSRGLTYSSLTLLGTVFFFFVALFLSGWRLTRLLGFIYFSIYTTIIVLSSLFEMNVFGPLNLPPCPRRE